MYVSGSIGSDKSLELRLELSHNGKPLTAHFVLSVLYLHYHHALLFCLFDCGWLHLS